jgi:hypothetical protein
MSAYVYQPVFSLLEAIRRRHVKFSGFVPQPLGDETEQEIWTLNMILGGYFYRNRNDDFVLDAVRFS